MDPEVRAALNLCVELLATLERLAERLALAAGVPEGELTARESEVMSALAGGATPQEIARELQISVRTVHKHLEHAYRKLGVTHSGAATARLGSPSTYPGP